ncbi:protein of unknown function [Bartonella clarridgeiae 73]|uniref:Uncharacterized protein n=1 Tax=Bartonella clarridgeiae (strain CCUG 45776 / CIP 104772 / 73) TaxID=696125 RepID=E6YGV0_BARC7|nr:protein of unknown function [Bartonella clarridgeiae 73]
MQLTLSAFQLIITAQINALTGSGVHIQITKDIFIDFLKIKFPELCHLSDVH